MDEAVGFLPIGHVRVDAAPEEVKANWEALESSIEVLAEYEAGLSAIEGFSHLIVVFFMHELAREARSTLLVKPRGLLRLGLTLEELPTIGVFACDSPARPNPIGVSVVQFLGRNGRSLQVRGLDALGGTPVLDIKPYTADRSIPNVSAPAWHDELLRKAGARRV